MAASRSSPIPSPLGLGTPSSGCWPPDLPAAGDDGHLAGGLPGLGGLRTAPRPHEPGGLPAGNCRATPYIYSEDEICALVHAAGTLARHLHAASCQAVISLLAASGMRIGEAVMLARHDADLGAGLL